MMSKGKWVELLASAMLGFGVGAVFGGGRLVQTYDWETEWLIDAPVDFVYKVLTTPEEQKHWWPSMMVQDVTPLTGTTAGYRIEYRVRQAASVARFAPPFKIIATTAEREEGHRLRTVVTGDLIGVLETLFFSRQDNSTRIVYHWYVRVRNPVLNMMGFLMAPMFRASHDHVMEEGEVGLQRYCQAQRVLGKAM